MMIRSDKSKLLLPGESESGFTLVEVLVTVLVTSLGLLGLAALQINSVRTGQDAYQYTLATQLTYDVADRMRANNPRVNGWIYASPGTPFDTLGFDTSAGLLTCAPCTPADVAQLDKTEWALQLVPPDGKRPLLPQGEMKLSTDDGSRYTVTVTWGSPIHTLTRSFNL